MGLWHLGGTRIPAGLRVGALVTMDAQQGADLLAWSVPRSVRRRQLGGG